MWHNYNVDDYLADCCGVTYESPCLLVRQVNQFDKLDIVRPFCFGRADRVAVHRR